MKLGGIGPVVDTGRHHVLEGGTGEAVPELRYVRTIPHACTFVAGGVEEPVASAPV